MALMIVRFSDAGTTGFGRLLSPAPSDPRDELAIIALATPARTTAEIITQLDLEPQLADRGARRTISASQLLSPVTDEATLICQGLNYRDHAAEAGHHERKANLFFAKSSSSLSGPYADIVRPSDVELLDYEVEIGVVLRKALTKDDAVDETNVGAFLAGVVLCNDVSARDTMFGASFLQWFQGKSYRTFCPTGPILYLLEPAEVAPVLEDLNITLSRNGKLCQSATSSRLIYKPAETLAGLAAIMDLKPGDMVLTGTPGGVIAQGTPGLINILKTQLLDDIQRRDQMRAEMKALGRFLGPGDTLTLSMRTAAAGVELGSQRCEVVDAAAKDDAHRLVTGLTK